MARQPFFGRGPAPQIARMNMQAATAPGRNWGAAFESIGQTVGDTLEKFRADKEKKKQQKILGDTVYNLFKDKPEALGADNEDELRAITNGLEKNKDALNFVMQFQRDAQITKNYEQIMEQRGMLIESLGDKKDRELNLARFMTTGKDPELTRADFISESIAPGKTLAQRGRGFDPDVRRGKKKLLPPSFYDPKSYERTPAPMELGLPERFQRIANDPDLDPRSKMEAMAQVKAEAAALAGPEQELQRDMRLAAYKDQLGGATGPIDTTASDVTNDAIGRALPLIGSFTTGFGSFLKHIPDTEAKTLDRLLATVRANVGFEKLAAMRRASPTGGALGNVSDKEIQFLQAVLGDLDQANDDAELTYNLKLVQHMFNNIVHGKGKDNAGNFYHPFRHPGDPTEAGGQPPAGGATSEDIEALRQQIERKTALEAERAAGLEGFFTDPPVGSEPAGVRDQRLEDFFKQPPGSQ